MAGALTAPLATAALVLCFAAVAKLRSPASAASALAALGLPGQRLLVRAFAAFELALGAATIAHPAVATAAAVALVYLTFAAISLALARRQAACGCFGETDVPASAAQSLLSTAFVVVAIGAAIARPHGIGWVLGHSAAPVAVLSLATVSAAWASVLAYTQLPRAWAAWSGR